VFFEEVFRKEDLGRGMIGIEAGFTGAKMAEGESEILREGLDGAEVFDGDSGKVRLGAFELREDFLLERVLRKEPCGHDFGRCRLRHGILEFQGRPVFEGLEVEAGEEVALEEEIL
jgi:hypothetical protein